MFIKTTDLSKNNKYRTSARIHSKNTMVKKINSFTSVTPAPTIYFNYNNNNNLNS